MFNRLFAILPFGALILVLLSGGGQVQAQEKVERYAKGQINWTTWQMTATASKPPYPDAADSKEAQFGAELAAKQQLWRDYMDLFANVRLNSNQTVAGFLASQQPLRYRVRAALRNFRQSQRKVLPGNVVEIASYMPFDEYLAQVLYSDMRFMERMEPWQYNSGPTGILIDGRQVGLKPALLPKIKTEAEVIFDAQNSWALWQGGPVIYVKERCAASAARVGDRPLLVSALQSSGKYSVDVVVSPEDGKKLQDAALTNLLLAGRVAILVD